LKRVILLGIVLLSIIIFTQGNNSLTGNVISTSIFEIEDFPPTIEPIDDIVAEINDLIILTPNVSDDNGDSLTLIYSYPFNSTGRWKVNQTGIINCFVTVSDGFNNVTIYFDVLVSPYCGDNVCNGDENNNNCPQDCVAETTGGSTPIVVECPPGFVQKQNYCFKIEENITETEKVKDIKETKEDKIEDKKQDYIIIKFDQEDSNLELRIPSKGETNFENTVVDCFLTCYLLILALTVLAYSTILFKYDKKGTKDLTYFCLFLIIISCSTYFIFNNVTTIFISLINLILMFFFVIYFIIKFK
jgi:hypothetical protein